MAKFPTVRMIGPSQRAYAHQIIDQLPDGYVARFGAETRREAQNRKLWPMLADLQNQVPAMQGYSANDIKLRFLNALGTEMRFLPTLENEGVFPVGMSSSTLTVSQFAGLLDLIHEFGARNNVRWSDPQNERDAA